MERRYLVLSKYDIPYACTATFMGYGWLLIDTKERRYQVYKSKPTVIAMCTKDTKWFTYETLGYCSAKFLNGRYSDINDWFNTFNRGVYGSVWYTEDLKEVNYMKTCSTVVVPTRILDDNWDYDKDDKWVAIDTDSLIARFYDSMPSFEALSDIGATTDGHEWALEKLSRADRLAITEYLKLKVN